MLFIFKFLIGAHFLPSYALSSEDNSTPRRCRTIDFQNYGQDEPSIFHGVARGRFGNQLLGYGLLYQLQKDLGIRSLITKECKEYLNLFFTEDFVELGVLEDEICNWEDIPWEEYGGHFGKLYTDPSYRRGRFVNLWPPTEENPFGYRTEEHECREHDTFYKSYTKYVRNKAKFHPHISDAANKALQKVRNKYPKDVPLVFVGIHNRRTDHPKFMQEAYGIKPLKKSFFHDAIEHFRDNYEDEANVAFIYVSDDMEWGRKRLGKVKDVHFIGKGTKNGTDSNPENPVYDLALLVKCNNTIATRGTYSMWATVLAGGDYYTEYGPIVVY